jgi:N-methylhydantoinase A
VRYANQGYEITVPVPDGPLTATTLAQTLATFHQEHQRLYTYASPELPVELVNLRVSASGPARPFALQPRPTTPGMAMPRPATRAVYFPNPGGFVACPVYDDASLPPGVQLTGPAIITQDLSTIVVQPQHHVCLDSYGNIIMTVPHHP